MIIDWLWPAAAVLGAGILLQNLDPAPPPPNAALLTIPGARLFARPVPLPEPTSCFTKRPE